MSLILDALNRSEENRQQQLSRTPKKKVLSFSGRKYRKSRSLGLFVLVPLLIALLAVAAWSLWPEGAAPDVPTAEVESTEVRTRIVAERPRARVEPQPVEQQSVALTPRTDQSLEVAPVPRKALAQSDSAVVPTVVERSTVEAVSVADTVAQEGVRSGGELTRIFPDLNVSMHFYNPVEDRSLVRINGQLLHEGDSVDGTMVVTQITPTGAIVDYRGRLYELKRPGVR